MTQDASRTPGCVSHSYACSTNLFFSLGRLGPQLAPSCASRSPSPPTTHNHPFQPPTTPQLPVLTTHNPTATRLGHPQPPAIFQHPQVPKKANAGQRRPSPAICAARCSCFTIFLVSCFLFPFFYSTVIYR